MSSLTDTNARIETLIESENYSVAIANMSPQERLLFEATIRAMAEAAHVAQEEIQEQFVDNISNSYQNTRHADISLGERIATMAQGNEVLAPYYALYQEKQAELVESAAIQQVMEQFRAVLGGDGLAPPSEKQRENEPALQTGATPINLF